MSEQSERTAAEMLEQIGKALFEGDYWQPRLAVALRVRRDTIRQWLHGTVEFDANHGALDNLLAVVARRKLNLSIAEADLRDWLQRNRTAPPGKGG